MEPFERYASVFILLAAVIAQLYSAFKVINKSDNTSRDLENFRKDYAEHIQDYNNLARDVAFIKGSLGV